MAANAFLIGCGPGDAALLTLKAIQTFEKLQIALIDNLVSKEIVSLLSKQTLKIYTGKSKGAHSFSQEAINKMLYTYAKNGYTVARLKAGDPFVFGRGSEEAIYLLERGVDVEIIPGISSALAAPLSAGIPVTARGVASSFSVVTAHLKEGSQPLEWVELLKIKEHTTVILMGLSAAKRISDEAINAGVDANTPVAIIQKASCAEQFTLTTTIERLPIDAQKIKSPAVIVVGECVRMSERLPHYIHESIKAEVEIGLAC